MARAPLTPCQFRYRFCDCFRAPDLTAQAIELIEVIFGEIWSRRQVPLRDHRPDVGTILAYRERAQFSICLHEFGIYNLKRPA